MDDSIRLNNNRVNYVMELISGLNNDLHKVVKTCLISDYSGFSM